VQPHIRWDGNTRENCFGQSIGHGRVFALAPNQCNLRSENQRNQCELFGFPIRYTSLMTIPKLVFVFAPPSKKYDGCDFEHNSIWGKHSSGRSYTVYCSSYRHQLGDCVGTAAEIYFIHASTTAAHLAPRKPPIWIHAASSLSNRTLILRINGGGFIYTQRTQSFSEHCVDKDVNKNLCTQKYAIQHAHKMIMTIMLELQQLLFICGGCFIHANGHMSTHYIQPWSHLMIFFLFSC